jgi:hypothetical protein
MFHWNPLNSTIESWKPHWDSIFSEKDRLKGTTLFFFFKNKKGCTESVAQQLVEMQLYREKYPGLRYTEEQERILQKMMEPIIHSGVTLGPTSS